MSTVHYNPREDVYEVRLKMDGPTYERLKDGIDCTKIRLIEIGEPSPGAAYTHDLEVTG